MSPARTNVRLDGFVPIRNSCLHSPRYPSLSAVWIDFDHDLIADQHSDPVKSHFSRKKREHLLAVVIPSKSEHGVRQRLDNSGGNGVISFVLVVHQNCESSIAETAVTSQLFLEK